MQTVTRAGINTFNKVVLTAMEGIYLIKPEDIIYCKASDSYTHFYLQSGEHHIVSRALKDFEDMLTPHNFFRIHKSYLINVNHILMIKKNDGTTVMMSNNAELPISFRRKDAFLKFIKRL